MTIFCHNPLKYWTILFTACFLSLVLYGCCSALAADTLKPEWHQQAAVAYSAGDWATAAEYWELLRQHKPAAEKGTILVALARVYLLAGHYSLARQRLETALELADQQADAHLAARAGAFLGNLHSALGPPETASEILHRSLTAAQQLGDPELQAQVFTFLGHFYFLHDEPEQAQIKYDQALTAARRHGDPRLLAEAHLNLTQMALARNDLAAVRRPLTSAIEYLSQCPAGYFKNRSLIRAGRAWIQLLERADAQICPCKVGPESLKTAFELLSEAARSSAAQGDRRTQSYALGYIGQLYMLEGRYAEALDMTRLAAGAAQQAGAPESLYQWEWQRGRLFLKLKDRDAALAAYRRALDTLAPLRDELQRPLTPDAARLAPQIQPLYLELVDILLQQARHYSAQTDQARQLEQATALRLEARERMEDLREVQLQAYFQDECILVRHFPEVPLEQVSPAAAIIYPIVLPDRLEVLISTSFGGLQQYTTHIQAPQIYEQIHQLQGLLEKRTTRQFLRPARQLYDWLIRPLEAELVSARVDTLVFVPYGPLLTIPLAVLEDGHRFLIENYALATIPSLSLTDPRPLARDHLRLLALGLSKASQGFPSIPHVQNELDTIRHLFENRTLINETFRLPVLENTLQQEAFTVLHIASHGQFERDLSRTFLLTYDGKLSLDDLDRCVGHFRYREHPLELLTLSACQTAAGDEQAALGLAGVAIKAGARSALATLWFVNDQAAADLVTAFYRHLQNPNLSKAQALQQAQLMLLQDVRYAHPVYWGAFILINNWL